MRLDNTDITIMRMLQKDARTSYTDIAKICEVSVDTIIKRFQKLQEEGYVRQSTIILDPRNIGYQVIANLSMGVEPGKINEVLKFLCGQKEVIFATSCMGEYNIFAISISKTMEEMNNLKEKIHGQDGIIETQMSIWIEQYLLCPKNFELEQLKGA